MTRSKVLGWIILVLVAIMFLSSGARLLASETITGYQQQEKTTEQQKEQEKAEEQQKEQEKAKQEGEKKDESFDEALSRRMGQGESMFEILGIPTPEDYMPTGFEIFLLWLIPFSVIVAVVVLILLVSRRRHQRILAMIEKGILPNAEAINHYRATQFRWDVFLLLTGLILGLGGIGLSVFMMGHKGPDHHHRESR